jgi:putative DNA primase/helicase
VQIPVDERDERLSEKLRAEGSGIFNWALKGLRAWRIDGKLHEPKAVSDAVNEYRSESDYFGQFLAETVEPNDFCKVGVDDVYRAYCRWADGNGLQQKLNNLSFGKIMKERNYPSISAKGGRYYKNLALKGNAEPVATAGSAEATSPF